MKILIVEYEEGVRRVLNDIIKKLSDHEVITCDDKKSASKILEDRTIDLALIDLKMVRDYDGLELLAEMKKLGHPAERWLMSGGMTREIAEKARAMGATMAVNKIDVFGELLNRGIVQKKQG